jgi:hypothetical protein
MDVKMRGGVMSILKSLIDRKSTATSKNEDANVEFSSLVSGISGQSVDEIDHLIEGLRGVREKLNDDGDRLHREIVQHTALCQSIIELTKIISDGMAAVNKSVTAVPGPKDDAKHQPE